MTERKFDENADLSRAPVSNNDNDINVEYALGDLHANACLMLYFLKREGILILNDQDYLDIHRVYYTKLYDSLTREFYVEEAKGAMEIYRAILEKATFTTGRAVHFIGDTLADRSKFGDHYVLYNYKALHDNHVSFDVCLSNHDFEFITAYWRVKRSKAQTQQKNENRLFDHIKKSNQVLDIRLSPIAVGGQAASAFVLNDLFDAGAIDEAVVAELVENKYFPHLNLFSYTLTSDGLVLMTHAPIDFGLIECAALGLGVDYRDETPQALARTIDAINDRFNQFYVKTGDIIDLASPQAVVDYDRQKIYNTVSREGIHSNQIPQLFPGDLRSRQLFMTYVVAALTWNRKKLYASDRPATHRGYSLHYVHGHTYTQNDPENVTNLDSVFGKYEAGYKAKSVKENEGYRALMAHARAPANEKECLEQLEHIERICWALWHRYENKISKHRDTNHLNTIPVGLQNNELLEHNQPEKGGSNNDQSPMSTEKTIYFYKKELMWDMLSIIQDTANTDSNRKIREVCKIYNQNQNFLEKEWDPTNKQLIKGLKLALVGVGFLAGVVPGLIALGVFAKISNDKTGSMNFLSDEANKTSETIKLKSILRKG